MHRSFPLLLLAGVSTPALAQRTTANAVTSSDDAFGRAVGNDRIGIYSPEDVRGFNPVEAGNARIEGLYFDQVSLPNNRLIDNSSIRVGYAAQAWPFPSPTGIVNLQLEKFTGDPLFSAEAEVDESGNYSTTLQAKVPIAGDKLGVSLGRGSRHSRLPATRYIDFTGYAANLTYRPRKDAEFNLFWSSFRAAHTGGHPLLFPAGSFAPPHIPRKSYLGQPWAHGFAMNHAMGFTAKLPFGQWLAELGLFRSLSDPRSNFTDLALGVERDGRIARETILADQQQPIQSNSGELRVSRSFGTGSLRHRVSAMMRGRQQQRQYGGQVSLALGATSLFNRVAVQKPAIAFGPLNTSRVRHVTGGLAYEALNANGLRLGASLQRGDYRKRVDVANPGQADSETRDKPWLVSANATIPIAKPVLLYAGYVEGLEETPVAPEIATNSNEAPPAARTRQMDAGVRVALSSKLTLITGVFEIRKPYYNLDSTRRYGELATITNRGLEFSLSGSPVTGLTVVGGGLLLDPRLNGPAVASGQIVDRPVGAPRSRLTLSLDWRPGGTSPWSFDMTADANGGVTASSRTGYKSPARESLNLGVRYRFKLAGASWLARGQIINVFNDYGWRVSTSGSYSYAAPRSWLLSLAADL